MDAVKFLKESKRICDTLHCTACPIGVQNNGKGCFCSIFKERFPEESVAKVEQWSKENPVKTRLSVFKEQYPVVSDEYVCINICAGELYGFECGYKCEDEDDCVDCWNVEVE